MEKKLQWPLKAYYLESPNEFVLRWQKKLKADQEREQREIEAIILRRKQAETEVKGGELIIWLKSYIQRVQMTQGFCPMFGLSFASVHGSVLGGCIESTRIIAIYTLSLLIYLSNLYYDQIGTMSALHPPSALWMHAPNKTSLLLLLLLFLFTDDWLPDLPS